MIAGTRAVARMLRTMTLRRTLAALLAGAALLASPLAFGVDERATVTLGTTPVQLPVLPGFAGPSATPAPLRDLMSRAMPPSNRFLAVMPTQDFVDRRAAGEMVPMSRYLLVQTVRSHEQNGISRADFERLKTSIRQQDETLLRKAREAAQASLDSASKDLGKLNDEPSLALRMGEAKALGVFDETPDSISFADIQSNTATDSSGTRTLKQAAATSIVLLGDKTVGVSVYSVYQSPADVDWVKQQAIAWRKQYLSINAAAATR